MYLAKGDAPTALEFASQAAAEAPSADAAILRIRALLLGGDVRKASDAAAAVSKQYPNVAAVQTAVGLVAVSRNDRSGAAHAFQ